MQTIIVILILLVTVILTLCHYYRRFTGKSKGCECCRETGCAECNCRDKGTE